MGKTNILVVDDLRNIRITLGGILEDRGHNVVTVEDGYRAIEAVASTHFDAIFMDIKMPGINGVQTFREIKRIDPRAVVIMMTAYSVDDLVREALEEGAYTVVYKPFDIDRIVALIDRLLADNKLILIVDEQFDDRETLKKLLEARGYRVATAVDSAGALEMVRERHYDIIFLDSRLADTDGVETFARVKEIDPDTVVIIMTGGTEEGLVSRAVYQGSYACIRKPFDVARVMTLLEGLGR